MTTLTDFEQYYKTISNAELLDILENPDLYQPLAVEAAKAELVQRGLSEEEWQTAGEVLLEQRLQKQKKVHKLKAVEGKWLQTRDVLLDSLDAVHLAAPSTDKMIRYIAVLLALFFLYSLGQYRYIIAYAKDFTDMPLVSGPVLLQFIILPVATFAFWKKKHVGWMLLAIFLTYAAADALYGFVSSVYLQFQYSPHRFFKPPSATALLLRLLVWAGILAAICKQSIRAVFAVAKYQMKSTIIITGVVFLVLAFVYFLR